MGRRWEKESRSVHESRSTDRREEEKEEEGGGGRV